MKKNIFKMAAVLMGLSLAFSGCSKGGATQGNTDNVIAEAGNAEGFLEEDNGIKVSLTTDKGSYKSGETINYTLTIENNKENWAAAATTVNYSITEGIGSVTGEELPMAVPQLNFGQSVVITGGLSNAENALKVNPKKSTPSKTTSNDGKSLTIRPYVKVKYGEEEVTIRATIEFAMYQQAMNISSTDRMSAKRVVCHDPSIFRDFDGKYYIFGSFLAMADSDNLTDWASHDSAFQGSFTKENRDLIKEWNEDDRANGWNGYLWAPDVIYNPIMEKYCMYLSADGDDWKSNLVLLTADSPAGPYDYVGSIVYSGFDAQTYSETDAPKVLGEKEIPERYVKNGVKNHKWGDMYPNCIDPCVFYDDDGNLWMSYGSWSGGIFMLELDEETGLRDYNVTYETNIHSDAYFGKKIAGGAYVSGEASYIQKIGDYYYLFISYGNLEAKGGYNVRVFRSEKPDGEYVDALGKNAFYDTYTFNYNLPIGVRLFGGYKWRSMNVAQVAQGHNSAFVDEDGRAYIVFHTRTSDGSEGHYVKVQQLFVNKEGWIVAAPYLTQGESLDEKGVAKENFIGKYDVIRHKLEIDYGNYESNQTEVIELNADGTITGDYEGSWEVEEGTPYVRLTLGDDIYSGVALYMNIESTTKETLVFTGLGQKTQVTLWASKCLD